MPSTSPWATVERTKVAYTAPSSSGSRRSAQYVPPTVRKRGSSTRVTRLPRMLVPPVPVCPLVPAAMRAGSLRGGGLGGLHRRRAGRGRATRRAPGSSAAAPAGGRRPPRPGTRGGTAPGRCARSRRRCRGRRPVLELGVAVLQVLEGRLRRGDVGPLRQQGPRREHTDEEEGDGEQAPEHGQEESSTPTPLRVAPAPSWRLRCNAFRTSSRGGASCAVVGHVVGPVGRVGHVARRTGARAAAPRYSAASPSSASIRSSWLYLATRSERAGAPALI